MVFLNQQIMPDSYMNNLEKNIKPTYDIFPLITVESHYYCDDHFIYYDVLIYAKRTLQHANIDYLLMFHKNKKDSIWRTGTSSLYTDTNYKFTSTYSYPA